jgi:putative acetyltransferase
MEIRAEQLQDKQAIRQINLAAFRRSNEADLVDKLRGVASTLSFVAVEFDRIIGHIFYSPVEIARKQTNNLLTLGLAPIAVLPDHQRQGIGSLLIRHSLSECLRLGCQAVFVLGSPQYYSRFGFIAAKEKGLKCEYKVPDELFMVLELKSRALEGCSGIVKYRSEFQEVE